MLELRTIALSLGIFWMIALWTWTSQSLLENHFGNAYIAYKKRTPRFL